MNIAMLLLILKWIGMVFLCLLGLCILLLCMVLFIPVRYRLQGKYHTSEKPYFMLQASWFMSIVSISLKYDERFIKSIKIMGIQKKPSKKESMETKEENVKDSNEDGDADPESESYEKKHSTKTSFYDKIKKGIRLIQTDEFSPSLLLFRKKLGSLLKSILPKSAKANGTFGFEDPALTGKVCAYLGMLYPILPKGVLLFGDFESNEIHVSGKIKGRIYIVRVLCIAISFLWNRNVRILMKKIKSEDF